MTVCDYCKKLIFHHKAKSDTRIGHRCNVLAKEINRGHYVSALYQRSNQTVTIYPVLVILII